MRYWSIVLRRPRALEVLVHGTILLTLVVLGRQLWTTDLGMDTRASGDRLVVTAVDPGGAAERAGIAVGDEIVGQPGLDLSIGRWTEREMYASSYRLGRAMASGHVPTRVRRGERESVFDIVPRPAPSLPAALRQLRRLAADLPTSFAFLGVAALLVRLRSRSEADDRGRRLMAASCACFGPIWTIEWPAAAWPTWLYPLASFLDVCSGAAGVLLLLEFAWSYPTRSRLVDRRALRWAVVIAVVPCAAYSMLNTLDVITPIPALRGNGLVIAFDSAVAVGVVAGLAWQRARATDVIARRQATWLLASIGIGIGVPILLLMVPQRIFGWTSEVVDTLLFPFPMLIPIGFAAVVARYRLFAFDGLALRAGPYAIAVVTSLLVCVLLTLGLQAALEWRTGTASDAARWVGVLAAVLVTEPLRRFLQARIDRVFARDRDAFLRQCSDLAAKISGATDARTIEATIQSALDAKEVKLLAFDDVLPHGSRARIRAALVASGTLRVLDVTDAAAVDALHALGFELLVLVPPAEPDLPASHALALTLPRPAHLISRPEHDALALVGRVIGAALAQAAARRALAGELRRSEDERRHIAMELHDGLGSALAAASLMTRSLRGRSTSANEGTLDALEAALRDGLGDLRASLWSLDPEHATWDGLVARVRRQASDTCAAANVELGFDVDGARSGDISAAARLAVLRVIQEAVSNALRHASPKRIDIRMAVANEHLEIVVEDDGSGIDPGAPRGRGLGNMARRIEALAGTFRIERREPAGTRVSVTLPEARVARDVPDERSAVTSR